MKRGKIMFGSSDNSGGVVVGALVCGTECGVGLVFTRICAHVYLPLNAAY